MTTSIFDLALERAKKLVDNNVYVKRFLIGKSLVFCELSDNAVGVIRNFLKKGDEFKFFVPGSIHDKKVLDILDTKYSEYPDKLVQLAVISAISSKYLEKYAYNYGDAIDFVDYTSKKIVLIGYFESYASKFKNEDLEFKIIELYKNELPMSMYKYYVSWRSCYNILATSDIVIITGSTLLNDTLETAISLCKKDAKKILVGPSASFFPDLLFNNKIDIIGTISVQDPNYAYKIISEGGTPKHLFKLSVAKKIVLTNEKK